MDFIFIYSSKKVKIYTSSIVISLFYMKKVKLSFEFYYQFLYSIKIDQNLK